MIETKVSESVHHDGRNRGRGENDRTSEVEQLPHNSSAIKVGNEKAKQNRMRSMMGRRFRARVDGSFEHGQFISVDVNGVIHKGVVFNEAKVDYVRRLSKSEAASLGCQLTKKRKVDPAAINNPEPKRMRVESPKIGFGKYCEQNRASMVSQNPSASASEIDKLLQKKWRNLTESERVPSPVPSPVPSKSEESIVGSIAESSSSKSPSDNSDDSSYSG
eukprot:193651_1